LKEYILLPNVNFSFCTHHS